ncbi:hypothetical protein J8273_6977 [Carpediemonas membranifera]|uniref:Uncharacterized protein n=1 Tax=Carpediemonas membranifera TaxID=201153 RepID=A0A8J6BUU7_9EUKA|nr:hypothetical protein J8273_6977 [Carpediemonas membranifera]|eukprot:KAG9390726.1 hypothetical protein J8273_6977 [Carpediemonas membranifera]
MNGTFHISQVSQKFVKMNQTGKESWTEDTLAAHKAYIQYVRLSDKSDIIPSVRTFFKQDVATRGVDDIDHRFFMFVHPVLPRYLPRLVAIRDCKTDSIISALLLTKESYNTEATDETPSELRQDLYVVVIRTAFYARGNGLATILLSVASAGQRIRLQWVSSLVPAYQRMGMSISKQKVHDGVPG